MAFVKGDDEQIIDSLRNQFYLAATAGAINPAM